MLRKLSLVFAFLAGPAFSTGLEITVAGEANGMIKIDLWEDVAPLHVEQVTKLAGDGFYDNRSDQNQQTTNITEPAARTDWRLGARLGDVRGGTNTSPVLSRYPELVDSVLCQALDGKRRLRHIALVGHPFYPLLAGPAPEIFSPALNAQKPPIWREPAKSGHTDLNFLNFCSN